MNARYILVIPALTVALVTAATLLSTHTIIRPDVGSVTFGFPFSWVSVAHGFIRTGPVWQFDYQGLLSDILTWFLVSALAVFAWMRLSASNRLPLKQHTST